MSCIREDIFPTQKVGNTFKGITMTFSTGVEKTPIDLTNYSVKIQFKEQNSLSVVYEFSTENGYIEITDALNGEISIGKSAPFFVPNKVGRFMNDIQLIDSEGEVNEYIQNYLKNVWVITDTVTK